MIKLTDEEKETLSYNDVAYLILKDTNKKIKIQDLFKEVIKALDLPEDMLIENEEDIEEENSEDNYDDDSNPEDDTDNDLQDLVIIDEDSDDLDSDMM